MVKVKSAYEPSGPLVSSGPRPVLISSVCSISEAARIISADSPGWYVSPLQDYAPALPIYIPGWTQRHCESKVPCPKTQHNLPGEGSNLDCSIWREAWMAQWWGHLPPTNVSRVRFPDPASYVDWFCCWFSSLLREVFLRVLRFSPLLKNQHFQIPIDLDYCQALYHEPLAWVIVQALPVFDVKFTFTFFTFTSTLIMRSLHLCDMWITEIKVGYSYSVFYLHCTSR